MERPTQRMRGHTRIIALFSLLIVLIAAPLIAIDRYHSITLQSGAVFAASPNTYSLSAPVRLLSAPVIDVAEGTLSIPPTRTGLARSGQVIAMLLTGSGPQLTLEYATFTVDFAPRSPTLQQHNAAGNAEDVVAPLVQALQGMQFDGLVVRKSVVQIRMENSPQVDLKDFTATVSRDASGTINAKGSFDLRGERLEFDTTLGAAVDAQGISRPLRAAINSAPITAAVEGNLLLGENPRLTAPQTSVQVANLRALTNWLGIEWSEGNGFGPFRAKGQMEWSGRNIAFQNASIDLDGNSAVGTLGLNFTTAQPLVEGTLGFKTLDLNPYFKGTKPFTSDESLLQALRSADNLDFPHIPDVDADLRISADNLAQSLASLTIGRSAITLSVRDNKVLADIAELEFADGTRASGQVRIDLEGDNPRYAVQAKFDAADLGRPLLAIFGHPSIQGRGILDADITTSGSTGEALLHSLDGKFNVVLIEGGRVGIDVNRLTATTADNPLPDDPWKEIYARAIAVDRLDARFTVSGGVIRTQSANAVSGPRALNTEGAIDILNNTVALKFAVSDAPVLDASQSTVTGSVESRASAPTNIVTVKGPWTTPVVEAHVAPVPSPAQPQSSGDGDK
ncbi:hypothetical protein C6Y62_15850 [Hyphomicrobium sulfonivorans]|nr:hypothetical protein [Hyphomicrobium sulfonivorans]